MINLSKKLYLHPTIALYLGGAGVDCGKNFEKIWNVLAPEAQELIEYFFIDSVQPHVEKHNRSRHYYFDDLKDFETEVYQHFYKTRFPHNIGESPLRTTIKGCGVTRIFGAASLVSKMDNFQKLIAGAYDRIRSKREGKTSYPLQVFITASACGGTGAGMLLDAAAFVRTWFDTYVPDEYPTISLFIMGPDIFSREWSINRNTQNRMRASAYAFFKELNHFTEHPFHSSYKIHDEPIKIGNTFEKRLFDMAYYLNAASKEEITWMTAEAQIHLCTSEIGYQMTGMMPNIREQFERKYPEDFVSEAHTTLQGQDHNGFSRKTFLCSFATRTVRFPAPEITDWIRHGIITEGIDHILKGAQQRQFSLSDFNNKLENLLNEGRLSEAAIRDELTIWGEQGFPKTLIPRNIHPDEALYRIEGSLSHLRSFLHTYVLGQQPISSTILALSGDHLDDSQHDLRKQLDTLCWEPYTGYGVAWMYQFITHALTYFQSQMKLEESDREGTNITEIQRELEELTNAYNTVKKKCARTQKSPIGWIRLKFAQLTGSQHIYSEKIERDISQIPQRIQNLEQDLEQVFIKRQTNRIGKDRYRRAIQMLEVYRDEMKTIHKKLQDALTEAEIKENTSYNALKNPALTTPTTVHIVDDDVLNILKKYVVEHQCGDIFSRIQRDFIQGMTLADAKLDPGVVLDEATNHRDIERFFEKYVSQQTDQALKFLEHGWNSLKFLVKAMNLQDDMRQQIQKKIDDLLSVCAQKLDSRMDFSRDFSEEMLGDQRKVWLIAPVDLPLQEPFGQIITSLERCKIPAQDPLSLTMISFTLCHPTNSLRQMDQLFRQYMRHIGDHKTEYLPLRYPLHTFKAAAQEFHEPHCPLELKFDHLGLEALINLAKQFKLVNDENDIVLDIREFEATPETLASDWNYVVELCEKFIQYFEMLITDGKGQLVNQILKNQHLAGLKKYAERKLQHGGKFARPQKGGEERKTRENMTEQQQA